MSELQEIAKKMGPGPATYPKGNLERVPGKQNWVDRAGGLPRYIERIASHIHYEKGKSIGHAIAIAVNAVKRMCATGDLNWKGKQSVNAGSRAAACAAVADWERKKAQARVSKGELGAKWTDDRMVAFLTHEVGIEIRKCDTDTGDCCDECRSKKKKKKIKKRDFNKEERKKAHTVPGTDKYPIENEEDLKSAIKLVGRSSLPTDKVKRHIISRAKALGLTDKLPDGWEVKKREKDDEEIDADEVEFHAVGEIEKRDDDQRLVFGWCSIAKHANGEVEVDKQGDVLEDIDQMEKVGYDFVLNSRDGGVMHVRKGVSTLVESFVSTPEKWEAMGIPEGTLPVGWWVGYKITDEEVWKGVKSGKYKMFSVHGSGTRKALDDD